MGFLLLPLLSVCLLSCSGTTSGATVVTVREGSEAVLPCFIRPERDITRDVFDWRKVVQKDDKLDVFEFSNGKHDPSRQDEQFKGRVSHFPDQLQFSNASIVIRDTKLSDRGNYTCEFSPGKSDSQMSYIELVVDACSEPIINRHEDTRHQSLLQCVVRGVSPKPEVKWQDSDGNILPAGEPEVIERGGRFDVTLKTAVTKSGDYFCEATQGKLCHQIQAKTSVYIHDSSAGLAADVVVTFVVTLVGLLAKGCITQD